MNEELNAMVSPHSRLPLPDMRNQEQFEVDPIGIDAIEDALVGLNPIAVDIPGIRLLRAEAAVDVDLLDPGCPERLNGGAEPLQQPSTTSRETEMLPDLLQSCLIVS